jgi:hypothetical protein
MNLILPRRFKRLIELPAGPLGAEISTSYVAGAGGAGATGPTGPTGPAGATGATGATGTSGSSGPVSTVTTSGSQASVTFSSISGASLNMIITVQGKDTQAANLLDGLSLQFNGDNTSGNYTSAITISGDGGSVASQTVAASANGGAIGLTAGTTTANANFVCTISILGYANTTFRKVATSMGWATANVTQAKGYYFRWNNTAAITAVKLTMSTAFFDGSVVSYYLN